MIRDMKVTPVTIEGVDGFCVTALFLESSDSMWEYITHDAVFRSEARAERFLKRIVPWKINWEHWGARWPSITCAIQHKVKHYTVL